MKKISLLLLLSSFYCFSQNDTINSSESHYYMDDTPYQTPEDNKQRKKFIAIPVDRIDGFYATTNYFEGIDDKKIELDKTPTITLDEIIELRKDKNYFGTSVLNLKLNDEASQKFYNLTLNNVSKPIAIVFNRKIISLPIVFMPISEGYISIDGILDEELELIMKSLFKK